MAGCSALRWISALRAVRPLANPAQSTAAQAPWLPGNQLFGAQSPSTQLLGSQGPRRPAGQPLSSSAPQHPRTHSQTLCPLFSAPQSLAWRAVTPQLLGPSAPRPIVPLGLRRSLSADSVTRQEKQLKAILEAADVLKEGDEDVAESFVASLTDSAMEVLVQKLSERAGGGVAIGPGEHKITLEDFASIDSNKDGVISSAEFKQYITENQRVRTELPTRGQLQLVALASAVPFVGFGFMDNAIMILAGEVIEVQLGMAFGITTMCAAAIGNLISDVCGVGLGGTVEVIARKMGFKEPELSPEQMDMGATRLWSNLGAAAGVSFGCFLGMFPLLLISHDKHDDDEKKKKDK